LGIIVGSDYQQGLILNCQWNWGIVYSGVLSKGGGEHDPGGVNLQTEENLGGSVAGYGIRKQSDEAELFPV
jgi:hypothetical protein